MANATYHDPCKLVRYPGRNSIRGILNAAGIELKDEMEQESANAAEGDPGLCA